jgi:diaminohydroxyphosphoribosylaminopyrimidine deaminase/5-amino-6-(5-phosphoribosylamino)uracil reductase
VDTTTEASDIGFMRAALALARRGLGNVAPNPAVGCIIVAADQAGRRVVGRGWTQPGGRPHAETQALEQAGDGAAGTTAFVTLEPCAHHGQTPPCAEALIAAGVRRVVIACRDPDPRVDGGGAAALRAAGLDVETGLCEGDAAALNQGFFERLSSGRPMVTVKTATTLDGRIATRGGDSQWITGSIARAHGHGLRAIHDAVLIGAGTARSDNPHLTCRLPGLSARSPIRVVLDGHLSTPLTARLVATARQIPTWILTLEGGDKTRRAAYLDAGVEVIELPADADGRPSVKAALQTLGGRGVTRLLVEAGSRLVAGLFRAGVVDRLVWFHAPMVIGGDGISAAAAFGVDRLTQAPIFRRVDMRTVGADLMETYEVNPAAVKKG